MQKSFQTFLWLIVFGLTFVNTYAQVKTEGKPYVSLDNTVKSYFMNPEAECTGAGELIYDDGTFENGYGWNTVVTDGAFLSLATPLQYPWQFNTFCIALTKNGSSAVFTFDIIVYDNSGAGGTPGNLVATIPGVSATGVPSWPTLAFYDFDISSVPALASGSYYVGIRYNPAVQLSFYIGADESAATPLWPTYGSSDGAVTWVANEVNWPTYKAMGMRTLGNLAGPPCPVQPATNPSPVSGTTGVSITTPGNATWTNGTGTTSVEVFFGQVGNVVSVYSGAPISSLAIPAPLEYNKTYQWRVVDKNDTCSAAPTAVWSFTTEHNPNVLFEDYFADFAQWTAVGPVGLTSWTVQPTANAGGAAPELRLYWSPSFNGESVIRSVVINAPNSTALHFTFKFFLDWYALPSGTYALDATYDGGVTKVPLWSIVEPTGNVGPGDFSVDFTTPATEAANLQLEFSFTGNSFNYDGVYYDNMELTAVVPVELTSFAATTDNKNVNLNWSTATELNNSGFQIEKSSGSEYQVVGFVAGHGTTTDIQNYSYTDQNVNAGSYSYRLKQIDFNGTFEYSNVIEIEVLGVKEFALGQNYPNPFNPSTKINFSLAVDSKVSLKIFDVLGQEVATLINGQLASGSQEVSFNASSLNSGVYFYRIDADGIDGQKFSSVRKMILTK